MRAPFKAEMAAHAKRFAISAGLEAASVLERLHVGRSRPGHGVIFTLHHVRPFENQEFAPNRLLEIVPEFLDAALSRLTAAGYRFVAVEQLQEMLREHPHERFASMTLDDGNRNNAMYALPVFERHDAPFTVFVSKGLSEHSQSMWWETLAALLGKAETITFDFGNGEERIRLDRARAKRALFRRFTTYVEGTDEAKAVARIDALAHASGLDPLALAGDLIMDKAALEALAAHPLARLGAHTVSHRALRRLDEKTMREEMKASADFITDLTGRPPAAIAYPYGSAAAAGPRESDAAKALGFSVGVTTQPGIVTAASNVTYLPRMSLNGLYQKPRYVTALASGLPLKFMGR